MNATHVDLVFGSNSQLRVPAEVHATSGAQGTFIQDFVAARNKVLNWGSLRPCVVQIQALRLDPLRARLARLRLGPAQLATNPLLGDGVPLA